MTQRRSITYDPLDHQEKFHESRKPMVYLSTGYGGGKSYSLVMKAFQLMDINFGMPGGLLCPSLKMFKRDVLPLFREICSENGVPFKFNKQDFYFQFPDTKSIIYVFHDEDKGASIRGPNLAFMLINEVTLVSKEGFDAALGRVRIKKAPFRQTAMSGTPEGFNWCYDYFVKTPRKDTDLIFGDMRLNVHVAEDYAARLMETYDDLLVQQYVEGQFVNLAGSRACYAFNRFNHTSAGVKYDELRPIWVSMDFNVNPMSATLWQPLPRTGQVWLQAYDEICINASDTYEFSRELKQKVGVDIEDVTIYPDPMGKSRSTNSLRSDFDILKQHGFSEIKAKTRTVSVRSGLNALNNLFAKGRIMINSDKCGNLITDLEQCILKQGTHEIDKKDPNRSHWLDGAKYLADYEFPVKKPVRGIRTEQIR
jgi:phage terminase large subunit